MTSTVSENTNVADEKVKKTMENFENSEIAKKIPVGFDKVGLRDIIKTEILVKIAYAIPTYLLISLSTGGSNAGIFDKFISFLGYFYHFAIFLDLVAVSVVYFANLKSFMSIALISAFVKNLVVTILIVLTCMVKRKFNIINIVFCLLFLIVLTSLDFVLLYHINVFFKQEKQSNEEKKKSEEV